MVVAMLSVGSRRSNGGGRFGENGIGQQQGQMEENELEEGETCLYNDFNNHFDPDVAFSYIDERIQDVLGHFQKDFEGVVSSETLGSKYGRYGSFLPVHQRSPSVLLQPKTPAIVQHSTQKSSNEGTVERIRSAAASLGNSVVPKKSTSSSTIVPGSAAVSVDMTNKDEMAINNSRGSKEFSPTKKGSVVKNASVNDQKKFTFRIKVPPDSLQRSKAKNAAIYSGLGLENSPSSSLEGSPDDRDDLSPSDEYSTVQTPMSIVQIMTSHEIPGGVLLSPMHEDLGKLTDGDDQDTPFDAKNRTIKRETHEVPPINRNEFELGKDFQGSKEMKGRSDEKQRKYTEVKKETDMESGKHSTNDLKKDLDFENRLGRELGSSSLKVPVKSTSKDYHYERPENEILCDPGKEKAKVSNVSKEIGKGASKEKILRADISKDEHKEIDGNIDPRAMKSESRLMTSSDKLVCKQNELDQVKEEKKGGIHKDTASEAKKLAKETAKHNKKYELSKDLTGYKEYNEQKDVKNDMSKDKLTGKLVSDEMAGIHKGNENNHGSTIKKKQKDTSRKASSTKDHSKEKSKDLARESYKDLRNDKHSVTSEINGEILKARKESKPVPVKDQYRDCVKDAGYEQSENRKDSLDGFRKDNLKQSKFDFFERGSSRAPEREKEREQSVTKLAASKKLDNASIADGHVLNTVVTQPLPGVVGADPATGPVAPIVINDNWVQCDACEKWRLLPYGVESSSLPQKWFCRMLDWLPAMNRCDISEEQTTQALHALYFPQPTLGPVDASRVQSQISGAPAFAAAPDIKQAEQNNDNKCPRLNSVSGNIKKGQVQRTLLNAPSSTSLPNSISKKSKQSSIKSKSLNDVVHQPLEQLQGGIGITNQTVKGNEDLAETRKFKQKEIQKWKLKQVFSDEVGYDTGEGSTHNLKRKREGEPDTRVKIRKSKDISSPKGDSKHEIGEGLSVLDRTFKDQNQTSLETDSRGTYSGLDSGKNDRRDFSAKKRKMKEWKQSQTFKEGFLEREYLKDERITLIEEQSETEHRKEKKVKTSKLEGKESTASKADVQLEKKGKVSRIMVSSQKDLIADGLEEQGRDGYEKENDWGQPRQQGVARRVTNGVDTLKRDMGYVQPFVAATSSSSKVSCSLKNFPNFQEVRGSPVESVSSSPMRISKVDKPSLTGRSGLGVEDLIDGSFPCLASPRRFSDGEGDAQSDRTGPARKTKNSCVEQPGSHESCRGVQSSLLNSQKFDDGDDKDKKAYKMDRNSTDIDHLVNGANVTEHLSQKKEKERCQEKHGERHNSDSFQERKGSREKITRVQDRERAKVALQKKEKDKINDSISNSHEELYSLGKDVGRRSHEGPPDSHVQSPYHEVSRSSKEIVDDKRTNRVDKDRRNDIDWKGKKKLGEGRRVNQVKHGSDENPEVIPSNFHTKSNRDSISKHPKSGAAPRKDVKANSQHSLQQDLSRGGERLSNQVLLDRNIHPESATTRDKSQSIQGSGDKLDLQGHGSGGGCLSSKGTRMEGVVTDGEFLRAPRESSRADNSNGALVCHSKPPVYNEVSGRDPEGAFSSPNRREHWQTAGNFIKEGKDLKHKGDNIKSKGGTELECTSLYFNAALKFLKGASLMEPFNAENARHGEKTQSMTTYTDTAKLCEYCAVTYERNKQMAAAALAYKCMGVAHMRVVISKNSCIFRDRHELQTAFQNALPGESPSSSASDVDNLNNHTLMDKSSAIPAKVAGSPQVAGDHVIVARHRPLYQRVLQYTNDTISAIEAFRKSDCAFSAANGSLDGANYQSAAISAVKRVMDFNFHDIDTLLHLVKLALEAIYH